MNSTFAPDWSVSGEELLRGWERKGGEETDGLIAVDVVALADLLKITGPVEVPYYGTLDSAAFTEKLIGDYDSFSSNEERKELNRSMMPIFADRVLAPGNGLEKVESLRDSARGRHFALWMRNPDVQAPLADIGLAGDLSGTEHDYLAVFNQNTNVSKSDYWQRRTVDQRCPAARGRLRSRAADRLGAQRFPALSPVVRRPSRGDVLHALERDDLGVFLPDGVEFRSASSAGKAVGTDTFDYYGRPYKLLSTRPPARRDPRSSPGVRRPVRPPSPRTAAWLYRLDLTPQGMVTPQAVTVNVTFPQGYAVTDLPEGWTRGGRGKASYVDPGLVTQPSFRLTGSNAADSSP